MIRFLKIEPSLGVLESSYRKAFLRSDASQAIFVIVLSNLASLALIRSDYESYGWDTQFIQFFAARTSVFLVSCISIFILAKSTQPKWHDLAVIGYMVMGALINVFINAITKPGYAAYIGVSIVLLNIYYFALFSPIFVRTTISCLFSAAVILQAYQSPLDFETKPIVLGMHLLTNLIGVVVSSKLYNYRRNSFKAQMEEKELQAELDKLASTDPLTGIWNRRRFTASAEYEFERAKKSRRSLSLILIDIDNLKDINDTHGHLMGDEVIRHCARVMNMRIRERDILGRLGGDEFGVLLPETPLSAGMIVGERIQELSRKTCVATNEYELHTTLSMGLAELAQTDGSFDDLFERADQMLYLAKQSGKNSIKAA